MACKPIKVLTGLP